MDKLNLTYGRKLLLGILLMGSLAEFMILDEYHPLKTMYYIALQDCNGHMFTEWGFYYYGCE
jgi:hypothetical protein